MIPLEKYQFTFTFHNLAYYFDLWQFKVLDSPQVNEYHKFGISEVPVPRTMANLFTN